MMSFVDIHLISAAGSIWNKAFDEVHGPEQGKMGHFRQQIWVF